MVFSVSYVIVWRYKILVDKLIRIYVEIFLKSNNGFNFVFVLFLFRFDGGCLFGLVFVGFCVVF